MVCIFMGSVPEAWMCRAEVAFPYGIKFRTPDRFSSQFTGDNDLLDRKRTGGGMFLFDGRSGLGRRKIG